MKREDFNSEEEYKEFRRKANLINKKYYSKPEVKRKRRIYKREYEEKNKERIRAWRKEYNSRQEVKQRRKKWEEENKEHLKNYKNSKEYKKKKKIWDKRYYDKVKGDKKVREMEIERSRTFRKNNPELIKKYRKKYYTSPKGIINYTHHNHRRLALIKERPYNLSNKKVKQIFERDKVCVYCGSKHKLELDHIVALKLGGNSLFNNFVVACKKCNTSKSGRDVFFWCYIKNIEIPKIVIKLLRQQADIKGELNFLLN